MPEFDMHAFALLRANELMETSDFDSIKSAISSADYEGLKKDASRLVKSMTETWIQKGAHLFAENAPVLAESLAGYLGLTGNILPAAFVAAVGVAAKMGIDNFTDVDTHKTKQPGSRVGDIVAIRKNFKPLDEVKAFVATEAQYGYSTLPARQVDVGIVMDRHDSDILEVVNLSTGSVENISSNDLLPFTFAEMAKINANPTFNKIRKLILEEDPLSLVEISKYNPTQGKAIYNKESYEIVGTTPAGDAMISSDTKDGVVPYTELEHAWQEVNYHVMPNKSTSAFSRPNLPFAGEFVYFLFDGEFKLGCIQGFKNNYVFLADCETGEFQDTVQQLIFRVDQAIFSGTYFKRFAQNTMEGHTRYLTDHNIGAKYPELLDGTSLPEQTRVDLRTFHNTVESSQIEGVVLRKSYNERFYHDYENEARQLDLPQMQPFQIPKSTDNAVLYIVCGAALLLIFSISS